ncbi:hypothetical protein HanRHA438_Chr12g0536481 [Helianthus annuus]|nr:hypothetical protein HanRHA438_Chr12g0536481 [Helianthus annuus]
MDFVAGPEEPPPLVPVPAAFGMFLETKFDSPRHHRQLHLYQWVHYYKCNHYIYHAQDSTSVIRYNDSALAIHAAADDVGALNT